MKALDVILIRSKPNTDAVVRLISDPLIQGLRDRGVRSTIVTPFEFSDCIYSYDCIIFHYDDMLALDAIRRKKKSGVIVCLGADIYDFDIYIRSHDIVDIYFAPTEAHCAVLMSQLTKPVCLLPEATDITSAYVERPRPPGKAVCWFGYPESFDKAMSSLMPVIEHCLQERLIDRFALITDAKSMIGDGQLEILPYSIETFEKSLSNFDYVILSHFALDLHLNSIIKSPNKLIAAVLSGLIPLASDTPNYGAVLRRYGLERFLFNSPLSLLEIIRDLDPRRDLRAIKQSYIRTSLIQECSPVRTSEAFIVGLARLGELTDSKSINITPRQWSAKAGKDDNLRRGLIQTLRDYTFRR